MSDQPEKTTWRQRLSAWWAALVPAENETYLDKAERRLRYAVIGAVLIMVGVLAARVWLDVQRDLESERAVQTTSATAEQVQQLDARVSALEAAQADATAEVEPTPAPARLRAPAAQHQQPAPASPSNVGAWSTPTDLDRALDKFSTTLQEPTQ